MIGLLLIYFIGKNFYDLARENGKNGWGYAILGVAAYYVATFIAGMIMFIFPLTELQNLILSEDRIDQIWIGLIAMPFGLLACWLLYKWLKSRFENVDSQLDEDVIDRNL
ncbi:MAG: hypothetical protein H6607_00340 [Flavobacteriales bacterium]|nr:hypothetical protein [Flavobacteriales bacterium]